MASPHWMKWQSMLVDRERYVCGVSLMMAEVKLRPVVRGIEVGLGWGVSGDLFLRAFPHAQLISFDTDGELEAIEKLTMLYPGRFYHMNPKAVDVQAMPVLQCQWLYIDAGHEYAEVKEDLRLYERFLEPGGVMAFDDLNTTDKQRWHYPGVRWAVEEFLAANPGRFTELRYPDGVYETGPAYVVKLP